MSRLRRVAFAVPTARAEEARAVLLELFPAGFEEVDSAGTIEFAAYIDGAVPARLTDSFGDAETSIVPGDWETRWRAFHHPVRVGRLWIGPPWEQPPDGVLPVVIDPGRAFGTGAHESTQLCLEFLQDVTAPESLLDVGCGSGVLAIAAAKLGYAPVVAVDNDPEAVEVARENAVRNGVSVDVRLLDALTCPLPAAALAVANVSWEIAEQIAGRFGGETLITAGYLSASQGSLAGYAHDARRELGGWAADRWIRLRAK